MRGDGFMFARLEEVSKTSETQQAILRKIVEDELKFCKANIEELKKEGANVAELEKIYNKQNSLFEQAKANTKIPEQMEALKNIDAVLVQFQQTKLLNESKKFSKQAKDEYDSAKASVSVKDKELAETIKKAISDDIHKSMMNKVAPTSESIIFAREMEMARDIAMIEDKLEISKKYIEQLEKLDQLKRSGINLEGLKENYNIQYQQFIKSKEKNDVEALSKLNKSLSTLQDKITPEVGEPEVDGPNKARKDRIELVSTFKEANAKKLTADVRVSEINRNLSSNKFSVEYEKYKKFISLEDLDPKARKKIEGQLEKQKLKEEMVRDIECLEAAYAILDKVKTKNQTAIYEHINTEMSFLRDDIQKIEDYLKKNLEKIMGSDTPLNKKSEIQLNIRELKELIAQAENQLNIVLNKMPPGFDFPEKEDLQKIQQFLAIERKYEASRLGRILGGALKDEYLQAKGEVDVVISHVKTAPAESWLSQPKESVSSPPVVAQPTVPHTSSSEVLNKLHIPIKEVAIHVAESAKAAGTTPLSPLPPAAPPLRPRSPNVLSRENPAPAPVSEPPRPKR